MVSGPALGWAKLESMMHISKATIRTTSKYVIIDATVDGETRDGFVYYDGNTREHEDAALIYLVNSVKLPIGDINFQDDREVPTTDNYDVVESVPLPELDAFFA